jgi:hypothetical protein
VNVGAAHADVGEHPIAHVHELVHVRATPRRPPVPPRAEQPHHRVDPIAALAVRRHSCSSFHHLPAPFFPAASSLSDVRAS